MSKGYSDIFEVVKADNYLDVLECFPKKYDDLSICDEKLLLDQSRVVIFGKIFGKVTMAGSNGLRFSFISAATEKKYNVMVFNQMFYRVLLKSDAKYLLVGKFKAKGDIIYAMTIYSEKSAALDSTLKPNYGQQKKISSIKFNREVKNLLSDYGDYIEEVLPQYFIKKYNFIARKEAFSLIHNPKSYDDIKRSSRLFKYEESLEYALRSKIIKQQNDLIKKIDFLRIDELEIEAFIAELKFSLTNDQHVAIKEIVGDMNSSHSMYRMLQGDVGTGKTIVAFSALFANFLRKKQGALLAPTETLASQHYQEAKNIFASYNLRIELLDSTVKIKQAREIKEKLKQGEIDILIGTHSLLSDDVIYNNLGLAIIDEQHKFGVNQRAKLKSKGENCDILLMSATPIPRTLTQLLISEMEVSTLREFPNMIRQVVTQVLKSDDEKIMRAIAHALEINRQVFIVAPRIDKSDDFNAVDLFKLLEQKFPQKVALMHGKMSALSKEVAYKSFKENVTPILVATTLIEVGINVMSAALLVVYKANYFGLASLHQLRGRIGRDGQRAMCILAYDEDDEVALARLTMLEKTSDGFLVAEADLKERGAGDLSSTMQHGKGLNLVNFVEDRVMIKTAYDDAEYLLNNLSEKDFYNYCNNVMNKMKIDKE